MRLNNFWPHIVLLISLFSCQRTFTDPSEYIRWVEDPENHLLVKREMDGLVFSLQFEPDEYAAIKDSRRSKVVLEQDKWDEMTHFSLTIENRDKTGNLIRQKATNAAEYRQLNYYYSFSFKEDIKLIEDGGDTLDCLLFHFVQDPGLSPSMKFLLAFENTGIKGDQKLVVYDRIFNIGNIKFHFDEKALSALPSTKFTNNLTASL